MILKGLLLIILIVLAGIGLLVSFIFFIIQLSNNHSRKWYWLGGFGISLLVLVFSVRILVQKAVTKATMFGEQMQSQFEKAMEENALNSKEDYHYDLLDSGRNETIAKLKNFGKLNKSAVPDEFYAYLGYMDYYRLPLTYPFSLHCNDVLETGELYNEIDVSEFNRSDNGEKSCNVQNIIGFAFDNQFLIAGQKSGRESGFVVFSFKNEEVLKFGNAKEAFTQAHSKGYSGPDTLVTLPQYYRMFSK